MTGGYRDAAPGSPGGGGQRLAWPRAPALPIQVSALQPPRWRCPRGWVARTLASYLAMQRKASWREIDGHLPRTKQTLMIYLASFIFFLAGGLANRSRKEDKWFIPLYYAAGAWACELTVSSIVHGIATSRGGVGRLGSVHVGRAICSLSGRPPLCRARFARASYLFNADEDRKYIIRQYVCMVTYFSLNWRWVWNVLYPKFEIAGYTS
jgi:hypothetical protein